MGSCYVQVRQVKQKFLVFKPMIGLMSLCLGKLTLLNCFGSEVSCTNIKSNNTLKPLNIGPLGNVHYGPDTEAVTVMCFYYVEHIVNEFHMNLLGR